MVRNSPGLDAAWLFSIASLTCCLQLLAFKLHFLARLYDDLHYGGHCSELLPLAWLVAKADITKRESRWKPSSPLALLFLHGCHRDTGTTSFI